MTGRACLGALLLVAALLGAPPAASAASNSLLTPQVSPSSGTVATVFTFRVSYDGKFAATGVRTEVAGLSLPMARIAGTALRGSWSTSSALPAGSWQVTFRATTAQGNAPVLAAATVSVAGPTAAPTAVPPPSNPRSPELPPGPIATAPPPAPTPTPDPGQTLAASAAPSGAEAPTEPGTGGALSSAGPDGSGPPTAGGGGTGDEPAVGPAGAPASPGASAAPGTGSAGSGESAGTGERPASSIGRDGTGVGGLGTHGAGAELLVLVLLVGLSGVAAVALVGTAILLAARRRAGEDASDHDSGEVDPSSDPTVEGALERRILRRSRLRLDEDPILAAMGIGAHERRTPRRRAGQTGSGPGERETPPR